MSSINTINVQIVGKLAERHNNDEIAKKIGISVETVSRYLRYYRSNGQPKALQKINVLLLDIETTPIESYTWDVWKQNIHPIQISKPSCMLSWSAKWLFDTITESDIMTPDEALRRDDERIVKSLRHFMEKADIVIAHNGQAFDIPKINTRFLIHGLTQPAPYKIIDTCLVARKYFAFEHNKLDYLAERLGLIRKIETDFQLWIDCIHGDQSALDEMRRYNENDVLLLEEVYVKLRPWIKDHPNLGLFIDANPGEKVCRNCGSTHLEYAGHYYTPVNKFESWRCIDCGAIGRSRISQTSLKKDRHILQAIS